jgi:hypothetical protein
MQRAIIVNHGQIVYEDSIEFAEATSKLARYMPKYENISGRWDGDDQGGPIWRKTSFDAPDSCKKSAFTDAGSVVDITISDPPLERGRAFIRRRTL